MTSCSVCGESLPAAPRSNPVNSDEFRSASVAVFDIDNTILDSSQRFQDAYRAGITDKEGNAKKKKALETMGKAVKRRNEFLYKPTNLAKDKVIAGSQALINDLVAKGYIIAYLTARPAQFHTETYNQLEEKGFPMFRDNSGEILLRTKGALGVKRETYKTSELVKLSQQYDVRMFFDDDKGTLAAVASEPSLDIPGIYSSIKEYRQYQSRSNPHTPYHQEEDEEDEIVELDQFGDPVYDRELPSKPNPPVKPRRKKMKNGKYRKEPAKKYVDRFMGNSKMVSEFPDAGQRYAVALSYVEKYYGKSGLDSVGARQNPAPNCGCGQSPCVTYGTRSNPEEYQEDYMVPRDIHRLGKAADRLEDTYEDGQEVPEWWKSKLSVAAKDTDTLADSLEYVDERGNPMPLMGLSVQVSGYRNAAGAFVMKGKKFLILQRSKKETSKHGLWELPGGKVEEGETPRQAAVIEAKEEAGLDIKLKTNLGPHHDNKKKKTYHAYIATPKKGQKVKLSEEHSAHKWVTPEEVLAMPKKMVSHHLLYFLKKEGETIRNNPRKNPPWFYKIEDAKEEAQRLANETGRVHYVIMNAYMMEDGGREIEFEVRDEPLVGDDSPTDYGEQLAEIHPETRDNPGNSKKIEKGKKLYKHMNGKEPEKIEKKKIDMGDVWYQVGEGGCWQIGYMSGKETGNSEQKYTHTFNEETKDGNFPKLYATMPENGKPLLIIQGGTWKIKTDDQGVAWIYD